jgi:hypothetical protein
MKHLRIPAAGEIHGAREDTVDRVYFSLKARVPFGTRFQTARRSLIHDTNKVLLSWCLNASCWSLSSDWRYPLHQVFAISSRADRRIRAFNPLSET